MLLVEMRFVLVPLVAGLGIVLAAEHGPSRYQKDGEQRSKKPGPGDTLQTVGERASGAARLYYRAFVKAKLVLEQRPSGSKWASLDPRSARASKLLRIAEPAIVDVASAAAKTKCDWGIALEETDPYSDFWEFVTIRPYALTAVGRIRIERAFADGERHEALDYLRAFLVMWRRLGGLSEIAFRFELETEKTLLDCLISHLGELTERELEYNVRLLKSLPAVPRASAVIRAEGNRHLTLIRRHGMLYPETSILSVAAAAGVQVNRKLRSLWGLEPENLPYLVEAMSEHIDRMSSLAELPLIECRRQMHNYKQKLLVTRLETLYRLFPWRHPPETKTASAILQLARDCTSRSSFLGHQLLAEKGRPVLKGRDTLVCLYYPDLKVPRADTVLENQMALEVNQALTEAAIKLVKEGCNVECSVLDPYSGEPLKVRKLDGRCEIVSQFIDRHGTCFKVVVMCPDCK